MDKQTQLACKTANKVALAMVYADTTGQPGSAGDMIRDALHETCNLLEQINPVELRDWYEQFHSTFQKTHSSLIEDPTVWSAFLGTQCDLFHKVGLHQKTIALLGDELAAWERQPVHFDQFAIGLDGLVSLLTDHSTLLVEAIERQSGHQSQTQRRSAMFANSVCGITICFIAISQAVEAGNPRDPDCAALATFGATLTNNCIENLFQVCKLQGVR